MKVGMLNAINTQIGKGINKIVQGPRLSNFLKEGIKDPAGFAAKMLVISLVSKDAANGVIYTYQSATNKRIPEDKRSFNAWLDALQGVFNVGGQLISYYIVDSIFTPKLFGKRYSGTLKDPHSKLTMDLADKYGNASKQKSLFLPDNIHGIVNDTIDSLVSGKSIDKNVPNHKLVSKILELIKDKKDAIFTMQSEPERLEAMKKELTKKLIEEFKEEGTKFKSVEKGFSIIVAALATTALVKRTLVPLVATPLAASLSEKQDKKRKKKELDLESATTVMGRYNNDSDKNGLNIDQFAKTAK